MHILIFRRRNTMEQSEKTRNDQLIININLKSIYKIINYKFCSIIKLFVFSTRFFFPS